MKKLILFSLCLLWATAAVCGVFTSQDGQFTLDMPSGWNNVKNPPKDSALSLYKGHSRLDVKLVPECTTETCIEKKMAGDLAEVKRKKMQVVGNTYTGEEIKRIDFSTGDPFFYISFYTPKNDFSSGYFLINGKAYSILAKDLTYAQADLIFSFISPVSAKKEAPKPEPIAMQMDIASDRAYDTVSVPQVQEESLLAEAPQAASEAAAPKPDAKKPAGSKFKRFKIHTLIAKGMPPYIKTLGHGFDALIGLIVLFGLLQAAALAARFFIRPRTEDGPVNPNSLYPIKFKRLYGTPSLIFRAKDNQGNILISLSSRWDSLFLFTGILLVIATLLVLAAAGFAQSTRLLNFSAFAYNMLYSACSLLIPLGLLIFFCGIVWSQLVLREITLFDRKGKKAVIVIQKGFGLKKERYEVYFARSKDILILERKRFSYFRKWQIVSKDRTVLAHIYEDSKLKAVLRKLTGHLWGLLRANYAINGQMESAGYIRSSATPMNRFTCNIDKPQAIEARDLLVASLVINVRDKDKWYPWFN